MADDSNGKIIPLPGHVLSVPREREAAGDEPYLSLRYRRRGRSISRVVAVRLQPSDEGIGHALELFFALG